MDQKVEAAAESLEITLDDWATSQAVLQLLAEQRDWKKLERAHRLLLAQEPDPERELTLSRGLAVLYRDQLHQDDAAIEIYRRLSERAPPDVADCLELAMLHERNRRGVEALAVLDASLRRLPDRPELYHRRFELCAAMGDVDGAWRSAGALFLMNKIETLEHASFYADHQLREPRTPLRDLALEDFLALRHPDENAELSAILKVARAAIPKRPRRKIVETRTPEELYLLAFYHLCDLFPQYELLEESIEALEALAAAAIAIVSGEAPAGAKSHRAILEHTLTNEAKAELARAVRAWNESGARMDLASWAHGARVSCASVALLIVGDPSLLEEVLARHPRVRDATAACFASALFGRLRADLGVGLTPPA
jgi:hypothetical protein